jgi:hypothetical protein
VAGLDEACRGQWFDRSQVDGGIAATIDAEGLVTG